MGRVIYSVLFQNQAQKARTKCENQGENTMSENFYKEAGKTLDGLVMICNGVFPTINEKLVANPAPRDPRDMIDVIRAYSVFATALNLLVGYSSSWNYTRKKLSLLAALPARAKKPEKQDQNLEAKLVDSMQECISQFRVLISALTDLSKKYDNLRERSSSASAENVKTFYDLSVFLTNEVDSLEKTTLPELKRKSPAKKEKEEKEEKEEEKEEEPKVKKGGGEKLVSLRKVMQDKLSQIYQSSDENTERADARGGDGSFQRGYKVTVGGFDARAKEKVKNVYVGGVEEVQKLKEKILKIQNLRTDLGELRTTSGNADEYYEEVFLVKLREILAVQEGEIKELLRVSCLGPAEHLSQMTQNHDPMKNLVEQIEAAKEEAARLSAYCAKRGAKKIPTLQLGEGDPLDKVEKILNHVKELLKKIDEEDTRVVKNGINKEFDEYESVKSATQLEAAKDALIQNLELLVDREFLPRSRHNSKAEIAKLLQELFEMVKQRTGSAERTEKKIVHVKPCVSEKDLLAMPALSQMEKILDILDYSLTLEGGVLPTFQEKEETFDHLSNTLRRLFVKINEMIAPENKTTCVGRGTLLAQTLIRSVMLPVLNKKRKLHVERLDEECLSIKSRMFAIFGLENLVEAEKKNDKWYCKEGLCPEILKALIEDCVL
jgi:hypothetical protein